MQDACMLWQAHCPAHLQHQQAPPQLVHDAVVIDHAAQQASPMHPIELPHLSPMSGTCMLLREPSVQDGRSCPVEPEWELL